MIKTFTILGDPMGKPRMTRADAWKKRKCVLKYFAWADKARLQAGGIHKGIKRIIITAYLSMPNSWSVKRKEIMRGTPHNSKPDCDNVLKAVMDSVLERDQEVFDAHVRKFWDNKNNPRIEVMIAS